MGAKGKKPGIDRSRCVAIGFCVLLVLSLAALLTAGLRGTTSAPSSPIPVRFEGEYSQNGGEWRPLTDDTRFNALEGDLRLRGSFNCGERLIHGYLDYVSIVVDDGGAEVFRSQESPDSPSGADGSVWVCWMSSGDPGGQTEILLSNALAIGNPNAYNDFLDNLYRGPTQAFENYLLYPSDYLTHNIEYEGAELAASFLRSGQFWRALGAGVFFLSLVLFGVAISDRLQSRQFGGRLWLLGALSAFAMGVMALDTTDVSLWHTTVALNVCGAQSCRMLWMLTLALFSAELLSGRRRTAAYAAAAAEGLFDAAVLLYCIFGRADITGTLTAWFLLQAAVCLTLLASCALELRRMGKKCDRRSIAGLLILLCAVCAEMCNARFGFWQRGALLHGVYVLLLIAYLARAVRTLPRAYRAERQAAEREKELTQSRISIMLSQIQPHFLYNSLNSIYHLCGKDPEAAQDAIANFSDYLRVNLDSLKAAAPVPFDCEFKHVEIYLSLEKMRFADELTVVYDIGTTAFRLPALTVQPLVENAVKYGVGKKPGGGTVTIRTREKPRSFEVVISDDGVGYDPNAVQEDGRTHIGTDNVRQRLAAMCGGKLSIVSAANVGTTATITIPKEART